jgi:hypothetical protein
LVRKLPISLDPGTQLLALSLLPHSASGRTSMVEFFLQREEGPDLLVVDVELSPLFTLG